MARYIDAEEFFEGFCIYAMGQDKNFIKAVETVLEDTPTADVVEVKHGHWVRQEKMVGGKVQAEAVCSSCGTDVVYQVIDNRWQFENYCPHCGARMDGDTQ